jgi:hypothetical protein
VIAHGTSISPGWSRWLRVPSRLFEDPWAFASWVLTVDETQPLATKILCAGLAGDGALSLPTTFERVTGTEDQPR